MHYRNFYQVLFCIFNSFCNSFLYFFGFTQTMTNNTMLHYQLLPVQKN